MLANDLTLEQMQLVGSRSCNFVCSSSEYIRITTALSFTQGQGRIASYFVREGVGSVSNVRTESGTWF